MADISHIEASNHMAAKQTLWRVAVGRFILGFGEIEWFTFHMLSELPSERVLESTMSLPFAKRVDIVIEIAKRRDLDPGLRMRLISVLEKAKKLAATRNLVAHNPLFLNLFDDRVGADLQFQLSRYGEQQAKLTFEELETRCSEVERLAEELYMVREGVDAYFEQRKT